MPDEITIKEALSVLKYIEGKYNYYSEYFRKYQDENAKLYIMPITYNLQAQAFIYKKQRNDE